MNYARVRAAAKKKIHERKSQINALSGDERTKLESHLVKQSELEELALIKAENEKLKEEIRKSDEAAMELLQKNEDLEKALVDEKNKDFSDNVNGKMSEENKKILEEGGQVAGYDPGHSNPQIVDTQSGEKFDFQEEKKPEVTKEEPKKQHGNNRQHKRR